MAKNDNAHALRFYESLSGLDREAALEFAREHPLSKSADYQKKFTWARAQCEFLEERFSPEEAAAVRAGCHCEAGSALAGRMRKYLAGTESLEAFAALFNEKEKSAVLEAVSGGLWFIYPKCCCACVKRVAEPIARTWCLCALGYVRNLFHQVLGREVEAELLETVKTGGERCVIQIIL